MDEYADMETLLKSLDCQDIQDRIKDPNATIGDLLPCRIKIGVNWFRKKVLEQNLN